MAIWQDVFTIISNVWFVFPAIEAYRHRRYWRMLNYLGIFMSSSIYHTCNSFPDTCWINADFHRKMDFWFAMQVIVSSGLYIVKFNPDETVWEIVFLFLSGLVTLYVQQVVRDSLFVQLALVAFTLLVIIVYWTGHAIRNQGKLPEYNWKWMEHAIRFTALSCWLYIAEMSEHRFYWAVHSLWHINAANAQWFLMKIRKPLPKGTPGLYSEIISSKEK